MPNVWLRTNHTAPPEATCTIDVSVVIANYNGGSYLQAALESIGRQTSQPAEIIVIDDGSTDGSENIAREFGAQVIPVEHGGVCRARNAGIHHARSTWVALMDCDDLWQPEKLQKQWAAITEFPDAVMVATDAAKVDKEGNILLDSFVHADFMRYSQVQPSSRANGVNWFDEGHRAMQGTGWYLLPSAVVARRDILIDVGAFDERFELNEDVSCFLRVLNRGGLAFIDEPLTGWRIHDSNSHHNTLGLNRGRLTLTNIVTAEPAMYPAWFQQQLKAELPQLYLTLGRDELAAGQLHAAQEALCEAMQRGLGRHAAAFWMLSHFGAKNVERLLKMHRALR